jgi:hypothetical protein
LVILLVGINDLLSNLVIRTFVIEKQQPQVRLFLVILLVGIKDLLSNLLTEEQPPQVRLVEGGQMGTVTSPATLGLQSLRSNHLRLDS